MSHHAQTITAIQAFHAHTSKSACQRLNILEFIAHNGGDWSIGELAHAMGLEKSTTSARINELLYETKQLVESEHRKDKLSNIKIRPVALPRNGQQNLF